MTPPQTAGTTRSSTIASVDKAVRLLDFLAQPGTPPLSLAELASAMSVNKSTLHHTLTTLRESAWVEQDSEGRYLLGPASAIIAHWWSSPDQLTNLIHPALEAICSASHETVHLGKATGKHVIYLDKLEPDRAVRVVSRVGRTVPCATTAMGRAILGATLDANADLAPWLSDVPDASSALAERLHEELLRVRQSGYAVEVEENEAGIACVGVPILLHDQVTAAISVTMPLERSSAEHLRALADTITAQVDALNIDHLRPYRPSLTSPRHTPPSHL